MPDALPGILSDPMHFTPTAQAAEAQLKNFVSRAGKAYTGTRNFDYGPQKRDNISCLSPYVRHRLITEEAVLAATLERHSASTAEKFIQEVFWRGYFKGWLEHHPSVWRDYVIRRDELKAQAEANSGLKKAYEEAIEGRAGIDCFDAWAQELVEHGYLHNHARMWFASIWIFTLRLPWQLGADFFLTHLLDGDAASNTCSWRWVAGLHTKGKNYIARKSNIANYTDGRFAPDGLNETAAPLEEDIQHQRLALDLPLEQPLPDRFALLLHAEDCAPESLALGGKSPSLALGLKPNWSAAPWSPATPVRAFAEGAIDDAIARAENTFGCASQSVESASAMIDALKSADVDTLAVPFIPTGPLQDIWQSRIRDIAGAGIKIVPLIRDYDRLAWPHASRGFFKLKQKIPSILDALSLT